MQTSQNRPPAPSQSGEAIQAHNRRIPETPDQSDQLHKQIAADADQAKALAQIGGPIHCAEFESLKHLTDSAADALHESLPATFQHHGKTYYMVTDIQRARIAIFENSTAETSMLVSLLCDP